MYINTNNLELGLKNFHSSSPFDHCVIDDFFELNFAEKLEDEFLNYDSIKWFCYKNAIEDKKALNDWNSFPALTYKVFQQLISEQFISYLSGKLNIKLYPDPGLHGGGWHIHGRGGNLNPHLDYSIHPKLGLQRKINIIIYLSSDLKDEHGGHLGLWNHDVSRNAPGKLMNIIQPRFNRAVIFDTTQNSWHGICQPLIQPSGIYRKSLAVYYLTIPNIDSDPRERALFAARDEQLGDKSIQELINMRADSKNYSSVYRSKLSK